MVDAVQFPDLTRLFQPRSVVVVGASDRKGSIGNIALRNIFEHSDFSGEVYLVNPSRDEVGGRRCYQNVTDLPVREVDVALLVTPAKTTLDVLKSCACAGVRHAIVITSGFGEVGDSGKGVERQMREIAESSGMRIYGPNCPGLTNINGRIGLNISPSFGDDLTGGPIGLVTQGGGMGRAVMQGAVRGPGVGLWGSAGNEADLDAADLIHHMVSDPTIKVIAAVIEGFRSGPRFIAAAESAAKAGKPILLLKIGVSDYGVKAALSHTAAMAGANEINDAVFRKYGVIRVRDLDELHETATLFLRARQSAAGSLAVFGFSGGACGFAADVLGDRGLHMAEFSQPLLGQLRDIVPGYAAVANPVDLTTHIFAEEGLHRRALEAVSSTEEVDVVVTPIPGEYGTITEKLARDIVDVAPGSEALIVPVWMTEKNGRGNEILLEGGVPPFRSMGKAADALARLHTYRLWSERPRHPLKWEVPQVEFETAGAAPLSEVAAKALIGRVGVRTPTEILATTAPEAEKAAAGIGGNVALKIVSPQIQHKTDVGGVALSVPPDRVARAFDEIMARVRDAKPEARIDGILVCEMVRDGVEILVGIHHDGVFGPILTLGAGGALVELLRDVVHIPLPLNAGEVARALDESRLGRLLSGFRGAPASDKVALVEAVEAICGWFEANADRIAEVEVNPVAVLEEGKGVVALDAMIRTR